jgi:SM-20-related protein
MTTFSLHPAIDVDQLSRRFAADGVIQIDPFLGSGAVELAAHLRARTDWNLTLNAGEKLYEVPRHGPNAMSQEQETKLRTAVVETARHAFQFCYEAVRVPDDSALRQKHDLLHRFADFMNGPAVLDVLRQITGVRTIDLADAQGTIYRAGDFLTAHDDAVAGKHRHAAYVFGLTEGWRTEWGGLLLFHDDCGDITRGLLPRMNLLSLFAVPQVHSVSMVTGSADTPRCSVTGWLRTKA